MKKPPLDVQAAARVALVVSLREVQCIELSAGFAGANDAPTEWALSWKNEPVVAFWQPSEHDERHWVAMFQFVLHIDATDDVQVNEGTPAKVPAPSAKSVRVAELTVSFRLEYAVRERGLVSEADIEHFLGINGFLNAWPYVRAEVQSLTTKIGLPPLLLPVQLAAAAAQTVSVIRMSEVSSSAGAPPILGSGLADGQHADSDPS